MSSPVDIREWWMKVSHGGAKHAFSFTHYHIVEQEPPEEEATLYEEVIHLVPRARLEQVERERDALHRSLALIRDASLSMPLEWGHAESWYRFLAEKAHGTAYRALKSFAPLPDVDDAE